MKCGGDVDFDATGNRISGAMLLSVAVLRPGQSGRAYRTATPADYQPIRLAKQMLARITTETLPDGLSVVPDEPINSIRPSPNARGLSAVTRYGMDTFGDPSTYP